MNSRVPFRKEINVKMIDNEEIQMDDKDDNMKISITPPLRNGV